MMRHANAWGWFVVAGVLTFAGPSYAQEATTADTQPSTAEPAANTALRMEDGAFIIKGKVQKPEVIIVVGRQSLDSSFDLGLQRTFLADIVSSIREETFDE